MRDGEGVGGGGGRGSHYTVPSSGRYHAKTAGRRGKRSRLQNNKHTSYHDDCIADIHN